MKNYNADKKWEELYTNSNHETAFPAEGVIRILKGDFPGLTIPKPLTGKILDLGCGDGRHFILFNQLQLESYGLEITEGIVSVLKNNLKNNNLDYEEINVGSTDKIPTDDEFFNYLLSWNSCYYMSKQKEIRFEEHVNEMARVLKTGGYLICSIPKKTSFVYVNSEDYDESKKYKIIRNDETRDGEIMRIFENEEELIREFSSKFKNFNVADIHMNWFGLNYHWHVFVAQKI